jgi:hypothetical protein
VAITEQISYCTLSFFIYICHVVHKYISWISLYDMSYYMYILILYMWLMPLWGPAFSINFSITVLFRHLRNGRGQQVLINLSVAMLCSSVLFLVGVDRTESYGGCIAVSAMLHYFILVTFLWMLVEGLLQYLRFVKVLGTYIPKFMFKTMIPAWGKLFIWIPVIGLGIKFRHPCITEFLLSIFPCLRYS